ncbi:MAG: DUF2147 domain-containing protein [Methyloligellaceae bacterium]
MKITTKLSVVLGGLSVAAFVASAAIAGSPMGTWERTSNGANIEVYECKGGLGMKVTKSPTPAKVGKVIMCGAQTAGENKWKGDLLSPDDGKTYTGNVTLVDAKTLQLEGCAGKACKGETWTKVK